MARYDLNYDILGILECRENEEFELFQRLSLYCQDTYSRIAASIEAYLVQEEEYEQKQKTINEQIARLHRTHKDMITEREDVILQQKVIDKKIAAATNHKAALEEEINDAKLKKESISLQMVDLTEEYEAARKQRKERWNAIKMACTYYKENLDIHIGLEQCNDHDRIKVTFFQRTNPQRDNYYVILMNDKDSWRVGEIEPALKEKHLEKINAAIDLTKPLGVLDVVSFLCKLRSIFLKHYAKT